MAFGMWKACPYTFMVTGSTGKDKDDVSRKAFLKSLKLLSPTRVYSNSEF
jgi:hypothetical protein